MKPPTLSVAYMQDGARLHYAQPMGLHLEGVLSALYTDWYNDGSWLAGSLIRTVSLARPDLAERMRHMRLAELSGVPVYDHKILGMMARLAFAKPTMSRPVGRWALRRTARPRTAGPLAGSPKFPDALMGPMHCFTPETVRHYQRLGIKVLLDQIISPFREFLRQRKIQEARWPGWEPPTNSSAEAASLDREEATLAAADHIVAAAGYVVDTLAEMGHGPSRVSLLPYPLRAEDYTFVDRSGRAGPITLGFVGAVNLRKGIPWLVETLKLLDPREFKCIVVGPRVLTDYGMAELAKVAQIVGPVPRREVQDWMRKFDILFFPSTCEGWGAVVAEAMATGLPVVTSPAGGSIVRDEVDGFVRPYDQPEQYAQAIQLLAGNQDLRLAMGRSARKRIEEFSVAWYGSGLRKIVEGVVHGETSAATNPPQHGPGNRGPLAAPSSAGN